MIQCKMQDFEIYARAMTYYIKKFEDLKNDEELKIDNDIVMKDIDDNLDHLKRLLNKLETQRLLVTLQENTQLLNHAMKHYLDYLTNMKTLLSEKINGDWDFTFYNINDEISQIESRLSRK